MLLKNLILAASIAAYSATSAFASLSFDCTIKNGKVFIDSSYRVEAASSAKHATDFGGTVVVIATDLAGNSVEERHPLQGTIFSNNSVTVAGGGFPVRLSGCTAYFVGQQQDR